MCVQLAVVEALEQDGQALVFPSSSSSSNTLLSVCMSRLLEGRPDTRMLLSLQCYLRIPLCLLSQGLKMLSFLFELNNDDITCRLYYPIRMPLKLKYSFVPRFLSTFCLLFPSLNYKKKLIFQQYCQRKKIIQLFIF